MLTPQGLCQIQLNCGDEEASDWQGFGAGVLIHAQWVLTAAHLCKVATKPELFRVVLGEPPNLLCVNVRKLNLNSNFQPETDTPVHADMALLHLAEPVTDFAVQPFLVDWDWYQSRWQHRQLPLQFWGRPYQEGYAAVVENDKHLHAVRREESDGVLALQMTAEEDTHLAKKGDIRKGFNGGPVLITLHSGKQVCVGITVQTGTIFGKTASTCFVLSTRLILPWLEAFMQSEKYSQQSSGNEKLYQTTDAKKTTSFCVFNWRLADDYQALFNKHAFEALLTWNTAFSPFSGRSKEQQDFNDWLESVKAAKHPGLSVRVVYGIGGVGKTRFVCEWAEDCSKQGWQVADASRTHWRKVEKEIALDTSSNWLIVLDKPERIQNQLFEAVRAWQGAAKKMNKTVAFVLISRVGEDRWQTILEENNTNELTIDYYSLCGLTLQASNTLLMSTLNRLGNVGVDRSISDFNELEQKTERLLEIDNCSGIPLMILAKALLLTKQPKIENSNNFKEEIVSALANIHWHHLSYMESCHRVNESSANWQLSHRLYMLAILFGDIDLQTLEDLCDKGCCSQLGLPPHASDIWPKLGIKGLNLLKDMKIQPEMPHVVGSAFAHMSFERMDTKLKEQFPHWCSTLLSLIDASKAISIFIKRYTDSSHTLNTALSGAYQGLLKSIDISPTLFCSSDINRIRGLSRLCNA